MAEVLSQSQIDALLSSLQGGDDAPPEEPKEPEKEYRKYDFYSPKKYTKEKLKMLQSIYDNYARIITSQINGRFRVPCEAEVVGVEEQRYYEFGNALHETDVITLARVELPDKSKNPPVVFHIAPSLMATMIDRMLGGTGADMSVDLSYIYTEIELALYENIIQHLVRVTSDVWASYIHFETKFERVEENPSMFQGISVDETVAIIMLHISMGDIDGMMNICIPGTLLGNIFEIIDKTQHLADKNNLMNQKSNKEEIMDSIRESKMEVMAQLGVARLNLDDVYNLRVGDVIDLNKPQDSEISIHVAGQPWFTGQLGVHNKNIAVKIADRVETKKEEEEVAV